MKAAHQSFINWSYLVEQKDELKNWMEWAFRGIVASSLILAISYVRSMSQDINQIALGMVELKSEARNTQTSVLELKARVERLESKVFFEKR
jgi:hypothetical protein